MSYSNFKDPLGLAFRMLRSRNKTAYFVLLRELLALLLTPLDLLLMPWERKWMRKTSASDAPVILVIGGSRSGTTLLYQSLVQYLPVSYLNNWNAAFSRSPITAYRIFNRFYSKRQSSFKSYYGSVYGFNGPNDGFPIWNRWFGSDRSRITSWPDRNEIEEMNQFMGAWNKASRKPFLNKNNRNSLCSAFLEKNLEKVFFVEIHREPVYVAQSLVISRKAIQGSASKGWGLLGKDTDPDSAEGTYIEDICRQVYQVDKQLLKGRLQIDPTRYYRVSYESFCSDPAKVIRDISAKALGQDKMTEEFEIPKFSTDSNRKRLPDPEFEKICVCIADLYGSDSLTSQEINGPTKEHSLEIHKDTE